MSASPAQTDFKDGLNERTNLPQSTPTIPSVGASFKRSGVEWGKYSFI